MIAPNNVFLLLSQITRLLHVFYGLELHKNLRWYEQCSTGIECIYSHIDFILLLLLLLMAYKSLTMYRAYCNGIRQLYMYRTHELYLNISPYVKLVHRLFHVVNGIQATKILYIFVRFSRSTVYA